MDEIRQTSYYANSLKEIIDNAASQNQPPLDYWIGHFVYALSDADFAVRLPAALFGTGAVLLLVMLISQLASWPAACGIGIVFALLPFNLYYSQEARPYAIAVFLFLCVIWMLNNFLCNPLKNKIVKALALLLLSVAFLHSRALSPFILMVCLLFILVTGLFSDLWSAGVSATEKKRLIILSCSVFILALIFYLPSLKFILLESKRYVPDAALGLNIRDLISAVFELNLTPIWRAYHVQSEPIAYPLLFLVCLSPFFGWYQGLHRKNTIWVITSLLLPSAIILNLIIFRSKSDMPFRPSYVSYILPMAFILGAVSLQGLWMLAVKIRWTCLTRAFILAAAAIFAVQTAIAAIDFKSMRRKSDWRDVTQFLTKNYDARNLLIFDSLSPYGSWEPTFYGFPRYYRGSSPLSSIERIPLHAPQMAVLSLSPVFILFQWREYYLTPHSAYPILSVPTPGQLSIDYKRICSDPAFICTEFTGFTLIQLRDSSHNLARDTYDIIEKLLTHFPEASWNVELYIAAAALARSIHLDQWHDHLMQAERMVHGHQLQKVKETAQHFRMTNLPEK